MAFLLGIIVWGVMFWFGFKAARRKTTRPVAQIFLGIFLGVLFMVGLMAVLAGIAFAGCAFLMSQK